jgi:hypothetical protein
MADVPQAARPRLFTPGCIGNVELKNRVVMPSMTTHDADRILMNGRPLCGDISNTVIKGYSLAALVRSSAGVQGDYSTGHCSLMIFFMLSRPAMRSAVLLTSFITWSWSIWVSRPSRTTWSPAMKTCFTVLPVAL